MSQLKVRPSYKYHSIKADSVNEFAIGVRDGVYSNAVEFPLPPLTLLAFQVLIDTHNNTRGAYKQGGLAQKGPYLAAKQALMDGMDQLAGYVNSVAAGDTNLITLSGFTPTKSNFTPINPPAQPQQVSIARGLTGELLIDCAVLPDADSYGALLLNTELPQGFSITPSGQLIGNGKDSPTPGPTPDPMPTETEIIIDLNKTRRKKFTELQLGVTYYAYYWAANAGGVSPLSQAVSKKVVEA